VQSFLFRPKDEWNCFDNILRISTYFIKCIILLPCVKYSISFFFVSLIVDLIIHNIYLHGNERKFFFYRPKDSIQLIVRSIHNLYSRWSNNLQIMIHISYHQHHIMLISKNMFFDVDITILNIGVSTNDLKLTSVYIKKFINSILVNLSNFFVCSKNKADVKNQTGLIRQLRKE
jgi:hypothetical protein